MDVPAGHNGLQANSHCFHTTLNGDRPMHKHLGQGPFVDHQRRRGEKEMASHTILERNKVDKRPETWPHNDTRQEAKAMAQSLEVVYKQQALP